MFAHSERPPHSKKAKVVIQYGVVILIKLRADDTKRFGQRSRLNSEITLITGQVTLGSGG